MESRRAHSVDRFFLSIVIALLCIGIFVFISASFVILARDPAKFYQVLISQLVFGLLCGGIAMYVLSHVPYENLKKYSFHIFFFSVLSLGLVFIPCLGVSHSGAQRWIDLGLVSFQPVELFKIGFIFYFSAWVAWAKGNSKRTKKGLIPLILLTIGGFALLYFQPDTKNLILIIVALSGMLRIAGLPWKDIGGISLIALAGLSFVVVQKSYYLLPRIETFLNPSNDPRGSSWQLQQSLIAIGSGGIVGRGFGQSIQKFSYLPEPQGDSIFAVIGEEFGFIGTSVTIFLFLLFALRGFRIANNSPNLFSRLLVSGIVILITAQSFMHIASITGVFPLTGVPLPFMSHGGTSLMIYLIATGIILNVSKFQKHESR